MAGVAGDAGKLGATGAMPVRDLSADDARRLWSYCPETGLLTWRVSPSQGVQPGSSAHSINRHGYAVVGYGYRVWPAHRLAWLIVTGRWPTALVDHINCDRADNRWANLREATQSQNKANGPTYRNSRSGLKGASYRPRDRRWQARIRKDGALHHLGYFATGEEAHQAYVAAAERLHGAFARPA